MNYVDYNYFRVKCKYNIFFKFWKFFLIWEEWINVNLEGDNVSIVYIIRIVGFIFYL